AICGLLVLPCVVSSAETGSTPGDASQGPSSAAVGVGMGVGSTGGSAAVAVAVLVAVAVVVGVVTVPGAVAGEAGDRRRRTSTGGRGCSSRDARSCIVFGRRIARPLSVDQADSITISVSRRGAPHHELHHISVRVPLGGLAIREEVAHNILMRSQVLKA